MKAKITLKPKPSIASCMALLVFMLMSQYIHAQSLTITTPTDIEVDIEAGTCGAVVEYEVSATNAPTSLPDFDFGGTFNGHTYFVSTAPNFWPQAEAIAVSHGAHLVAINDQAESDFVRGLTTSTFFIGLNDLDNEGTFVWSNGEPVTYTSWAPGEPNNNSSGEDVVEMFPGTGLWNDAKVSGVTPTYIIEFGSLPPNAIVCSVPSGSTFPAGTTTVTCTVTDGAGNTASSSFDVTVNDNEAPTVITKDITISLDAGNSGRTGLVTITPEDINDGSFDECGIANLTLDKVTFDCGDLGSNIVTFTATDLSGNVATATATVTIEDTTPPTILGLADITVNVDAGTCGAVVNYTASVDDNCISAPFFLPGFNFGGTFNGHTYFVSTVPNFWTEAEALAQSLGGHLVAINDQAENDFVSSLTTSTFWIGLNDIDNEGTFVWSNGDPFTYNAWGVNEPNNNNNEDVVEMSPLNGLWNDAKTSGVAPTYIIEFNSLQSVYNYSVTSGSTFPVGTTPVTFSATDGSGNSAEITFNVTVFDNEAPVAIAQDLTVSLDENGQANITTTDIDNGSNDACDFTLAIDQSVFDCSDLGDNLVTLTATDSSGNVSSATAIVSVLDNIPPTITSSTDIAVNTDAGTCGAVVNFSVSATDNCNSGAPTSLPDFDFGGTFNGHTYFVSTAPNFWPQAEAIAVSHGAHLVAINDQAESDFVRGLTTSTFFIGLNDLDNEGTFVWSNGEQVTYTSWAPGEPNNNSSGEDVVEMFPGTGLWNDAKVSGVTPTYIIEFNSLPSASVICSVPSGSIFPVGTTTVTCTASDGAGNTASSSFNVTVNDNETPEISNIPADIEVTPSESCSSIVTWEAPLASDNCEVSLTSTHASGDTFPVGVTEVTYTAMDESDNAVEETFTVTVNSSPITLTLSSELIGNTNISCFDAADGNITSSVLGGCGDYSYSWSNGATAADLNDLVAGSYTLKVADENGASTSESITLTQPEELTGNIGSLPVIDELSCTFPEANLLFGYEALEQTSVVLDGSATGGSGEYVYEWYPSDGLSNPNVANPVFSPELAKTGCMTYDFLLTITDTNGCVSTQNITVNGVNVGIEVQKKRNHCYSHGKRKKCWKRRWWGYCGHYDNHKHKTVQKVLVCHKGRTRAVNSRAVAAHLAHGDCLGGCHNDCATENADARLSGGSYDYEIEEALDAYVYPNPTNGVFSVELNNLDTDGEALLYNVSGKLVQKINIDLNAGSIEMGNLNLESGVYLLKINADDQSITKRIIVQ
ncbi:MAG: HYR domain-containing protein [Cyclobacteriaceae bacterium]